MAPARVGEGGGQQRGLARVQIARSFPERPACGCFHAEFAIRAPFCNVEIDFEEPSLAKNAVEPERKGRFEELAQEAASPPQEQVLRRLLRQRGSAADLAQRIGILDRLANFGEIDAWVAAEAGILGGDDRSRQACGLRGEGGPIVARPALPSPTASASGSRPAGRTDRAA
jgi:hypothetical protein